MKPIIFNTEMVKAILEGRKSQTRRVIKPQPIHIDGGEYSQWFWSKTGVDELTALKNNIDSATWWDKRNPDMCMPQFAPYQVGDVLWVRETWCPQMSIFGHIFEDRTPFYKVDGMTLPIGHVWKPSIHMPRWAARIFLEVTKVRVERLQEITEEDALKEGCPQIPASTGLRIQWFKDTWDSINKPEYSWGANPFVWVYEFKQVKGDNNG